MSKDKAPKMEPSEVFHFNTAKVKPLKKGDGFYMELIYEKITTDENGKISVTPISEEPPFYPHIDLFNALKELVPHMMIETEFMPLSKVNKEYFSEKKILEDKITNTQFKVMGIHIKESKEQRYVVLVGRRILKSGKVINLTPLINISNFEDGYPFAKELAGSVDNVIYEVGLYKGGKHAPKYQLDITDNEAKSAAEQDNTVEASKVPEKKVKADKAS